ncbi:MAG TPA: hypothetical protein VF017_07095 [Thermoanaerobaculia bacterium]|nr:hypothetical protein [Thermoanaerobaculia bacterium]
MKKLALFAALAVLVALAPLALAEEPAATAEGNAQAQCQTVAPSDELIPFSEIGDAELLFWLGIGPKPTAVSKGCAAWCRDHCIIFGEPCCILDPNTCGCC